MWSNTEDWQDIRKSPDLVDLFAITGEHIVRDLNHELHTAQMSRKQKVEDGYKFAISHDRDRIRMRIWAFTARAAAHEAKHQSILKNMQFIGDVKEKGGGRTNPGGGGGRSRGHTGGGGPRKGSRPGGSKGATRPTKSRRKLDPAKEVRLRRQLATFDALSKDAGATEAERKLAAEHARRARDQLGE